MSNIKTEYYSKSQRLGDKDLELEAYIKMIEEKIELGSSCFMTTLIFKKPKKGHLNRYKRNDNVETLYKTVLSRTWRHRPKDIYEYPMLVMWLEEASVLQRRLKINAEAGKHYHGLFVGTQSCKTRSPLETTLEIAKTKLEQESDEIERVHIKRLGGEDAVGKVAYYSTKKRNRYNHKDYQFDDILLPKTNSEMT